MSDSRFEDQKNILDLVKFKENKQLESVDSDLLFFEMTFTGYVENFDEIDELVSDLENDNLCVQSYKLLDQPTVSWWTRFKTKVVACWFIITCD